MDTQEAAAAGALIGMFMYIMLLGLAAIVLIVIARWRIFTKAGEEGWKSIIPIYNEYTMYKLVWDVNQFWIYFGLGFAGSALSTLANSGDSTNWFLTILASAATIAGIVWYVRFNIAKARAFGKGAGFAVGLIFLPFIFELILGFGNARYLGPQQA